MRIPAAPLLLASIALHAAEKSHEPPDLAEYHTTKNAVTTTIHAASPKVDGQTGYLGVVADADSSSHLVISQVEADSPASRAGLQKGDHLLSADGKAVKTPDELRTVLQAKAPGDAVIISIEREGSKREITTTLDATSRPVHLGERGIVGLRLGNASDTPGIDVVFVTKDKPAALAGIRVGDRIMKADDAELGEAKSLTDVVLEKHPGDKVKLIYRRANNLFGKELTVVADDSDFALPPEERRTLTTWQKPVFRLAVIGVEFSDAKHNPKVPREEWEKAYFSRDTYNKTNATGQTVYGSMADYYHEASCGKLRIEGKAFDWVQAGKKRMEYNVSNRSKFKTDFFNEIVQAVIARDGADALKDFDGLAVIYAGSKPIEVQRSSILWPHRASVKIGDKSWPYVIVAESAGNFKDGPHMSNISTMCHEFGHILGLPDLYARPEIGSEGAGVWTIMSNQIRNGRPQHFCAWCKEQLGWLTPVVIDPAVKQKLVLGPVEGSDHECYKIPLRPDGSEYFLLENRRKTGFDASLPAEGLLIWRVVANRPILEEAHGVEGPAGPRVFLTSVPWPSKQNHAFTPYTTPSSHAQLGGGASVNLTNIRELADGRIIFQIGYEYE